RQQFLQFVCYISRGGALLGSKRYAQRHFFSDRFVGFVCGHINNRQCSFAGRYSTACQRQKGSLMPGGNPSPPVSSAIFSCVVDSTRRTASLNAAAIKSSSISLSSPSPTRLSSIFTLLTS